MRLQDGLGLLLFGLDGGARRRVGVERLTFRRAGAVAMDAENLVQTKTGKQFTAANAAMHDVKMTVPEFLETQGDARHRAHKGGIHHGAILQINDELAVSAVDHFLGELLQVSAV